MGCCPSKHKGEKGANLSSYNKHASTEKIEVDVTHHDRPTSATLPVQDDGSLRSSAYEAPNNMLMDRGDGCAIERSDHESNNDCVVIVIEEDNQLDDQAVLSVRPPEKTDAPMTTEELTAFPPIDIVVNDVPDLDVHAPQTSSVARSPARVLAPTSPSKAPMNFDDIPINSMYHRIHVVEVEEQESKRRQEQQEEAERREREIQEFKAAMLASREG